MPNSVTLDSEEDLVFLTPEGEPVPEKPDQGASPHLRRSSRKRKSLASESMPKSSKKKKQSSPGGVSPAAKDKEHNNDTTNMPRVTRTPANESSQQPSLRSVAKAAENATTTTPGTAPGMAAAQAPA